MFYLLLPLCTGKSFTSKSSALQVMFHRQVLWKYNCVLVFISGIVYWHTVYMYWMYCVLCIESVVY